MSLIYTIKINGSFENYSKFINPILKCISYVLLKVLFRKICHRFFVTWKKLLET